MGASGERGLNKVLLLGRVVRDPEMRHTPDGTPVTTLTVAATSEWRAADGARHEAREWFNVVAWHVLAERCAAQLHEGARVYIEGRLQTRSWTDAEDRRQVRTEVVTQTMIPLDGAPEGTPEGTE